MISWLRFDVTCFRKRDEIACLLIHRGADLSYVDNNKSSYVHLAAYYDMATVIGLLVAQGADINAKVGNGIGVTMFRLCH